MAKTTKKGSENTSKKFWTQLIKGKSYREAADSFGVPKSTLYRFKKSDKPALNSKKGAPTVLTASEEENFVAWILYRAKRGLPVNKKLLLDTVKDSVKN